MQFPLFNYTFLARCSVLIARKRHFCTQFLRLSHIEILRAANQMHLHAFLFIVIIFLSSHSKFLCISVISVIQLILFASFVCIFYLNNAHLLRKYVREKKKMNKLNDKCVGGHSLRCARNATLPFSLVALRFNCKFSDVKLVLMN